MHSVQFEISKPTDESAFEDMCARIYGVVFDDPQPQTNGRRGQAQGGIDVFVDAPEGRIGIQCKKYADGALKFKHVEQEVSKADSARAPIVRLIVATTATSDAGLLRAVQELSDKRVSMGKYPVRIEFWQEICRHIQGNSILQNDYAPNAPGALFHRIEKQQAELRANIFQVNSTLEILAGLPSARADSINKFLSSQLDKVNDVLQEARFNDALDAVTRIGSDMALFDAHQQARWHVQRGICTWHLQSGAEAAADFLRAAELYPDDEKIVAAKIRGLLFLEKTDDAIAIGQDATQRFPASVHVWISYMNARLVKGDALALTDFPASMREDSDVLQLAAWSCKHTGDLNGAVVLSTKATTKENAGFFARSTALSFLLDTATVDPVQASHGILNTATLKSLRHATNAFSPRRENLWPVQSPKAVQEVIEHLAYSYIILGTPQETLILIEEARHADALSSRLKRVALDAYRRLNLIDEFNRFGKEWFGSLDEEGLILIAENASNTGDVSLIESVRAQLQKKGPIEEKFDSLLLAMRWVALSRAASGMQQALAEVHVANISKSDNIALICGGARILHAAKDSASTAAAIERAQTLVSKDASPLNRMLLADLLFETRNLGLAAKLYEGFTTKGCHSELHNRLLYAYISSGALHKARELIRAFPEQWTSDERALSLAIDLGNKTSDWESLVPLAEVNSERRPDDVGAWLLRLTLDLKMCKMSRLHSTLEAVPAELTGAARLLAHVAALELRFGQAAKGMRRLYSMFRRKHEDATASSAYLVTILGATSELPFMEDTLPKVISGSTVSLKNDLGEVLMLSLEPEGFDDLPSKEGFYAASSETAKVLNGKTLGEKISLPGPFGSTRNFLINGITSTYRWLLQEAQKRVNSLSKSEIPILSLSVPQNDNGADFSHVHAMLKKQSEHIRHSLQIYANGPITIGILSQLLGRNVIDIISGWPLDAPPLYVCTGTNDERNNAVNLLIRANADYVIDAATIAELGIVECLDVLSILPRVYISTKAIEVLEAHLDEANTARSNGSMYDENGRMRFVEFSEKEKSRRKSLAQKMLDAAKDYCITLPAYGPVETPKALHKFQEVLSDEEYAALLLSSEKNATLFSIDGRLSQIGKAENNFTSVWPQEVIRFAVERKKLESRKYHFAVISMFLRKRSFISLGPLDLVFMCLQGGYILQEGLQRFKEYLSSASSEYNSVLQVAFDFLELQAQHRTQVKAFAELLEHILEAVLRHPESTHPELLAQADMVITRIAFANNRQMIPYALVEEDREARILSFIKAFKVSIQKATKFAATPLQCREIKLYVLHCKSSPLLMHGEPPKLSIAVNPA